MKNFTPIYNKRLGLEPQGIYEYFLDNFWFKAAGPFYKFDLSILEPLVEHKEGGGARPWIVLSRM